MRRRLLVILGFAVCAFTADASMRPPEQEVRARSVSLARDWSALPAALDGQARWYAAQTTTTMIPGRSARAGGSHRGYATAKECVSMVEHGGLYDRSSNPTHFGRYQFDRGTWAEFGGNPDTWGSASPSEQDRVFETAWASPGGPGRWMPYDGC